MAEIGDINGSSAYVFPSVLANEQVLLSGSYGMFGPSTAFDYNKSQPANNISTGAKGYQGIRFYPSWNEQVVYDKKEMTLFFGQTVASASNPSSSTTVYLMRAYRTTTFGYVYWTVNNAPDSTGASSGFPTNQLSGISIIKTYTSTI